MEADDAMALMHIYRTIGRRSILTKGNYDVDVVDVMSSDDVLVAKSV